MRSGQAERIIKRADGIMQRVSDAVRRLPDQTQTPANVGGGVSSMASDPCFPAPPRPTFEDMGDY